MSKWFSNLPKSSRTQLTKAMARKSKLKKKSFEELSNEELALRGIEYVNKKDAIKELEAQCKECRKPLEEYVSEEGKVLDSGSKLVVLPHADIDVHLKQTLRVSNVLLPEAMDILKENGLEECIENVPVIREDVLERLYKEGKVPDEVLKSVYAEKKSYAFSVEIKERFGDAPE